MISINSIVLILVSFKCVVDAGFYDNPENKFWYPLQKHPSTRLRRSTGSSFYDDPDNKFWYPLQKYPSKFRRSAESTSFYDDPENKLWYPLQKFPADKLRRSRESGFYDDADKQFWYPLQKYPSQESRRSTDNLVENDSSSSTSTSTPVTTTSTSTTLTTTTTTAATTLLTSTVVDNFFVQFKGENDYLLNCTHTSNQLSCSNAYRTMFCNESFDVATLGNYSFTVYGFENLHDTHGLFSSNLIKYRLFPFKLMDTSRSDWLIYDYAIPIYGFEVKLSLENGALVSSNGFNIAEISCFNKLVFLLNEARLYNQMKIDAYLTAQDLINSFKFSI